MSTYKIHDQGGTYFLTLTVVGWVDVFSRVIYRKILIDNLRFCQQEKDLIIYAYVIMSNHLHLIAASGNGKVNLSKTLAEFKSFTAKEILKKIYDNETRESRKDWLLYLFRYFAKRRPPNRVHQFWKHNNHPIELWSPRVINQKLDYIHLNPVEAEIVKEPQHYIYSSASNYYHGTGILEVKVVPPLSEVGYISF